MIHSITSSNATDWTDQEAEFALGLILKRSVTASTRRDGEEGLLIFTINFPSGKNVCSGDQSRQKYARTQSVMFFAQGFCRRRSAFPLERMQIILKSPDSSGALTASGYRCRYVFEKWQSLQGTERSRICQDCTVGFTGLKSSRSKFPKRLHLRLKRLTFR